MIPFEALPRRGSILFLCFYIFDTEFVSAHPFCGFIVYLDGYNHLLGQRARELLKSIVFSCI